MIFDFGASYCSRPNSRCIGTSYSDQEYFRPVANETTSVGVRRKADRQVGVEEISLAAFRRSRTLLYDEIPRRKRAGDPGRGKTPRGVGIGTHSGMTRNLASVFEKPGPEVERDCDRAASYRRASNARADYQVHIYRLRKSSDLPIQRVRSHLTVHVDRALVHPPLKARSPLKHLTPKKGSATLAP
ncbi:hypothetical protein NL676_010489 [Syzygium grande]|nr:hypothetical protein NL676_010489 [Syzygium grande]